MSDYARLEEKLTKLRGRERAPGEARKLRGADAAGRLAALIEEIDETILPRRLTLTAADDIAVHLAVANRKLQAMIAPAPPVEGASDIVDKPLPDAEDPTVPALRAVLERVLSGADTVAVSAVRLKAVFGSDVGVPAGVLARAWNLSRASSGERSPEEVLDGFVKDLGRAARAWLRINGEEVVGQGGGEARLERLGEQAAVFLDGYFGKFDSLFPEDALSCATVIAARGNAGDAVLYIEYGEVSAFIAADPARVAAMAARWQSLVED